MSTDIHFKPSMNQLPEAAGEFVRQTADAAGETVQHATDVAKDMYQSAAQKAGDTLAISKEYVRQNQVLVVVGALAFGVAICYMLVAARRKPTFCERYVDEPLDSAHKAILSALAPVVHRLDEGFDSARNGAGKAMERIHRINPGRTVDSLSEQIGRVGSNLKFW
jgi:hypothetical protein